MVVRYSDIPKGEYTLKLPKMRLLGSSVQRNFRIAGNPLGTGPSSGDVEQQQGVQIISSWALRQVKDPDSRARFILFFTIGVPLHWRAVCGTELILDVKKPILEYTACDNS